MTISDPSIKAGDTIYVLTATGLKAVGTATKDGSASVTFTADPVFVVTAATATTTTTTAVHPKAKFRAIRTVGFAVDGRTTTLSIIGTGFYAQPRISSNEPGTRDGVLHDYGVRLIDRITTKANAAPGWHVLTIQLANGMTSKVRYLVKK
ncbi:MAG: hypothetical protein ACYC1I_06750 [Acidimicrobiales bacterium]